MSAPGTLALEAVQYLNRRGDHVAFEADVRALLAQREHLLAEVDRLSAHVPSVDHRCTCGCGPGVGHGHHEPHCGEPNIGALKHIERGVDALLAQRNDARMAAHINAETIVGLQQALATTETCLRALLEALTEAEGNAERFLLPPSPDCRDCTANTSPKNITCARHQAHLLLNGRRP